MYAVVAELLLDMVEHKLSDVMIRAYADDTALVFKNFTRDAPKVAKIFEEFQKIAGLGLNLKKSVIIPLNSRTLRLGAASR